MPLKGGAGDAAVVGWCWPWFLLAALVSPMIVGLRMDFSMLLEPLGFVKVLEWVSEAGGAVSSAVPGLTLLLCLLWVPLERCEPLGWQTLPQVAGAGCPTPGCSSA